jgi:hypothetical protein
MPDDLSLLKNHFGKYFMRTPYNRFLVVFFFSLSALFAATPSGVIGDDSRSSEKAPASGDTNLRLNETEIALSNQIVFKNFTGATKQYYPEKQIVSFGERMAREMFLFGRGGNENDYAFWRVLPEVGSNGQLMGADVLTLGPASEINHIRNIKRLLSGYLSASKTYDAKRADALITFILVYNAVKRNDREYFSNRYTSLLLKKIPEGKLGIDTSYENWSGKTSIVIPLLGGAAGLSAGELGRVSTNLEASTNFSARQIMVDIRKEQLSNAEKNLATEQNALDKKKVALEEKQKILDAKTNESDKSGNAQKTIEKEQAKIDNEQKKIDTAQNELDKKAIKNSEEKQAIGREEKQLASDLNKSNPNQPAGKSDQDALSLGEVFFLKTLGSDKTGFLKQELDLINPKNDTVRKVPLENITSINFNFYESDPLLVLAEAGTSTMHLCRIDRKTLQVKNTSEEAVFYATKIWQHEGKIYVISLKKGQSYLVRLDPELKTLATSDVVVLPDTQIIFAENKVYCTVIQGTQNAAVLVLNEADLKRLTTIR